jgi:hypothetical protein
MSVFRWLVLFFVLFTCSHQANATFKRIPGTNVELDLPSKKFKIHPDSFFVHWGTRDYLSVILFDGVSIARQFEILTKDNLNKNASPCHEIFDTTFGNFKARFAYFTDVDAQVGAMRLVFGDEKQSTVLSARFPFADKNLTKKIRSIIFSIRFTSFTQEQLFAEVSRISYDLKRGVFKYAGRQDHLCLFTPYGQTGTDVSSTIQLFWNNYHDSLSVEEMYRYTTISLRHLGYRSFHAESNSVSSDAVWSVLKTAGKVNFEEETFDYAIEVRKKAGYNLVVVGINPTDNPFFLKEQKLFIESIKVN